MKKNNKILQYRSVFYTLERKILLLLFTLLKYKIKILIEIHYKTKRDHEKISIEIKLHT